MKIQSLISTLFLTVVLLASGSEIREIKGGFAYTLPADWFQDQLPNQMFKSALGPDRPSGNPFISFHVETLKGNLAEMQAKSLRDLASAGKSSGLTDIKIIVRPAFQTTSNEIGLSALIQGKCTDRDMREFLYLFQGKGDKVIAIACVTTEATDDAVFDTIIKSFRTLP